MTKPHLTTLLVLGALCAASAALAAGRNAPAPAAPQAAPTAPAPAPTNLAPPAGGLGPADELALAADDDDALAPGDPAGSDAAAMGPRGMGGPGHGAAGMRRWGRGRGRAGFAALAARLQLSAEQREKLADIRDRQARKGIQARADLQIARLDMRKLMRADKPDMSAIDAQIDHIARVRADLAKARVASLVDARAVLTPEQLQQLHELRQRGPGGPGGPGGSTTPGGRWQHPRGHGAPDSSGHGSM